VRRIEGLAGSVYPGWVRRLSAASGQLVRIERFVMGTLVAAMFCVVLLNTVCRSLGWAIYWADELAVYLMIWSALTGASISIKLRTAIAVNVLSDQLPDGRRNAIGIVVDGLVLLSALCLLGFSWIWYDPVGLARHGFDTSAFKSATFNFIYAEPTITLPVAKAWIWLIMPIFAITATLHACSNLAESVAERATGRARGR